MPPEPVRGVLPTVLTRRGRLVVCMVVTLTAAAAVLALQELAASTIPTGAGRSQASPGPTPTGSNSTAAANLTSPSGRAEPAAGHTEPTRTPTVATTTAASSDPPAVVNGRAQPQWVEVPMAASGQLVAVPGSAPAVNAERVWTYRVEIEEGLPFDGVEFAAGVHTTLSDPRGWVTRGNAFQRLGTEGTDFRVVLASPALTDQLCAPLRTRGEVSCRNGDLVVLNALRWAEGIDDYGGDLASYREYMVNHEVGHRLGHGHVQCTGRGDPAPVMMQQTYGLDGCRPNPWPLPDE